MTAFLPSYPGDHAMELLGLEFLQLAAIVLLALLAGRCLARRDPATRHALWRLALVVAMLGPLAIFTADRVGLFLVIRPSGREIPRRAKPTPNPTTTDLEATEAHPLISASPPSAEPRWADSRSPVSPTFNRARTERSWSDLGRSAAVGFLALWAIGSAWHLARLLLGILAMQSILRDSRPTSNPPPDDLSLELRDLFGLRSLPPILTSGRLSTPVITGLLRPRILLPDTLVATMDRNQLRDVLTHECAHLSHHDLWFGLLQRLTEILFWPHPMIHLLNRELSRAREEVCDNVVLRNGDVARYARTLVDLAERRVQNHLAAASLGLFESQWGLTERIKGFFDERRSLMTRPRIGVLCLSLAGFLAIGLATTMVRPAAAAPPTEEPSQAKNPNDSPKPQSIPDPGDINKVTEDELAGVVVDEDGKPLEGVDVDVWDWYPGNETRTDVQGRFRVSVAPRDTNGKRLPYPLDPNENVEIRFRKEGFTPRLFLDHKPGTAGWRVTMNSKTFFEGSLNSPEGKPVANALIRAKQGPKSANPGYIITAIWTETRSGPDGHYRLYADPDTYDFQVRVPGVGVARLSSLTIAPEEAKSLDILLEPGIDFLAKVVDTSTGEPVPGVRLWNWQQKDVEGTSNAEGLVQIEDMFPGSFDFQVEAKGFGRWWSEQAVQEFHRRYIPKDERRGAWQRNFDSIGFEIQPGMAPVTIEVERGVTVRGRVLDPDGKTVSGATVAPALTGTGNSITGDTRYSVTTDAEGRYEVHLPASNDRDYNLIAHDGPLFVHRNWANGVTPPFRTKPGEIVENKDISLTRPATVRGLVVDFEGKPLARREVRATGSDFLDNRYYVPATTTDAEGRYELKFVRPGEQYIQVAPFWLFPEQAPAGTSRVVTLKPGETIQDVDLVGQKSER